MLACCVLVPSLKILLYFWHANEPLASLEVLADTVERSQTPIEISENKSQYTVTIGHSPFRMKKVLMCRCISYHLSEFLLPIGRKKPTLAFVPNSSNFKTERKPVPAVPKR